MRHPPHLYIDNAWYMITAATVDHARLLAATDAKVLMRDALKTLVGQFGLTLRAWVVMDNHYHLLIRASQSRDLPRFLGRLNGYTSRQINLHGGVVHRAVWCNYWDSCIRSEADLWTHFNYVHQNPVKHGYVQRVEDWPFSSYQYYVRTKGKDWLDDCCLRYPVIDFSDWDRF